MDPIDVVTVRPPGYAHAGALFELAETVRLGLRALGCDGRRYYWSGSPIMSMLDTKSIIIGGHLLRSEDFDQIPSSTIIYNTEQFGAGYSMVTPAYLTLLGRHEVWDVNPLLNPTRAHKHVPVGYMPEMTRIRPAQDQDIDVLFYGSMSPRREAVLRDLDARGLNVVHLFGVYGAERDAYIANAKVVLSMHYADGGQFESVRVSYLLANRKAVVCEGRGPGMGCPIESRMSLPYHALASACEMGATDQHIRRLWANLGFHLIRDMPETEILRRALDMPA